MRSGSKRLEPVSWGVCPESTQVATTIFRSDGVKETRSIPDRDPSLRSPDLQTDFSPFVYRVKNKETYGSQHESQHHHSAAPSLKCVVQIINSFLSPKRL